MNVWTSHIDFNCDLRCALGCVYEEYTHGARERLIPAIYVIGFAMVIGRRIALREYDTCFNRGSPARDCHSHWFFADRADYRRGGGRSDLHLNIMFVIIGCSRDRVYWFMIIFLIYDIILENYRAFCYNTHTIYTKPINPLVPSPTPHQPHPLTSSSSSSRDDTCLECLIINYTQD